jgi:hypothetical protein
MQAKEAKQLLDRRGKLAESEKRSTLILPFCILSMREWARMWWEQSALVRLATGT